jgi:hypothetical protein
MKILNHYLRAVGMYLPKGHQQEDILKELSENLRSQMEEKEAELGRPLTEVEQESLLTEHGSPMIVARRYGAPERGVSFGWELIGPEVFPLYVRILLINFAITIVVIAAITPFIDAPLFAPGRFIRPLILQFLVVTLTFVLINLFHRTSRHTWSFPPVYLQPIPRWQSKAGLVFFSVLGVWWAAVPYFPSLFFGDAAPDVRFSSSSESFYWPVLLLFLIGLVQRAATIARPDWVWLQAWTRLVINSLGLVIVYFALRAYPFVEAASVASDPVRAVQVARGISTAIWWNLICTLTIYLLFAVGYNAWLCVQLRRYGIRRRHADTSAAAIHSA